MGKYDRYPESLITRRLARTITDEGGLVLRELRLRPCEFDLVILEPTTRSLISIEVKRSNWRAVYIQSWRRRMYCHFSFVALPARLRKAVPVDRFVAAGIGILFYSLQRRQVVYEIACDATRNVDVNRLLKRQLYSVFVKAFGKVLNA